MRSCCDGDTRNAVAKSIYTSLYLIVYNNPCRLVRQLIPIRFETITPVSTDILSVLDLEE
jgi:hypothetical protein